MMVPNLVEAYEYLALRIVDGQNATSVMVGKHLEIHISVETDTDVSPAEYDCYSDEDKSRYDDGAWRFIGVKMSVIVDSVSASDSVWAIDIGINSKDDDRHHLVTSILPSIYAEASEQIRTAATVIDAANAAVNAPGEIKL